MAADILRRVVAGTAQVLCYCINEGLPKTMQLKCMIPHAAQMNSLAKSIRSQPHCAEI